MIIYTNYCKIQILERAKAKEKHELLSIPFFTQSIPAKSWFFIAKKPIRKYLELLLNPR